MANQKLEINRRSFKGVWLPSEIYLMTELSWTQKILLIEIDSLDGEDGCFASNAYFAMFLGCEKMYISQCISKLEKIGLIVVKQEKGVRRIINSNLKALYGAPEIKKEKKKKKETAYPTEGELIQYFIDSGYKEEAAKTAFKFYNSSEPLWHDSRGNKVINWKQKMISVWFKEENKITGKVTLQQQKKEEGKFPGTINFGN